MNALIIDLMVWALDRRDRAAKTEGEYSQTGPHPHLGLETQAGGRKQAYQDLIGHLKALMR